MLSSQSLTNRLNGEIVQQISKYKFFIKCTDCTLYTVHLRTIHFILSVFAKPKSLRKIFDGQ